MRRECAVVVDGQLGNNAPVCMTGSQNLRRDLCRVNFEVHNLKPFPHLAFPHFSTPENRSKKLGFNGELMASSPPTFRPSHGIVPDCRPTYNLIRLAWLCVIDPRFTRFSALN